MFYMEATVIILWGVVSLQQNWVYVDAGATVNLNSNGKILTYLLPSHTTFKGKILTDIPGKQENQSNQSNSVQTGRIGNDFTWGPDIFM